MAATSIDRAGELFASVVRAVGAVGGDVRAAGQLLALLGWDLPPGVADIGLAHLDVAAVAARLDDLTELRSHEDASDLDVAVAVGEVIAALADALDELAGLAASFGATSDYLNATRIADEFFPRLADLLVIQLVGSAAPAAVPVGVLLGLLEFTRLPADPSIFQVEHVRQVVRWDRFAPLLSDPSDALRDVYGWGTGAFAGNDLVTNVGRVLEHLADGVSLGVLPRAVEEQLAGHPVPEADDDPAAQVFVSLVKGLGLGASDVGVTLFALRADTPGGTDGGVGLAPYAYGTAGESFALSDAVTLKLEASAALEGGLAVLLRAGRDAQLVTGLIDTGGSPDASFALTLRNAATAGARHVLLSVPGLTLDAAALTAGVGAAAGPDLDPALHWGVEDGQVRVAPDRSDGFLAAILPADGVTATVSLDVAWSRRDGLRISGGAGLRTSLALHARLGPLQVDTLDLAISATPDAVTSTATVTGSATLGPFAATVGGVGAALALRFTRGNLGPVDLSADFVPPTGVGLSIDGEGVTGGGFVRYDPAARRYAGVLQLQAGQIGITGFGLLDTRLPGGASGYALLVALRASFPAIELGFGFALTSVGGLLAHNRRVDVDALRARLAAGTAGRILAPVDPVHNAPALLADLDAVFPVAPGVTVVGPTVQLVWAGLVHFDVGVFIELPGPSRVVLLGSAQAAIERDGRSYLTIRVDIVGVIDLRQRTAAFDAVLVNSQLLEVLDLTGGAAFRLSWGDQPYAVFTLGGFHPAYNPEPLVFPSTLTRLTMVHGSPADRLYLRLEGYFAVTSNTLQLGATVEAVIHSGDFAIKGFLGFDALIRFEPFHFQIDIRASVQVAYKGRTLTGLTLTGSLEGPGPVVLRAKVCIELLFFDICFSDTFTLGSSVPPPVTVVPSALELLLAELDRPATLSAGGAADRYVTLRPPASGSPPVLSPVGQLVWVQRTAPLGLLLEKIGGEPLASPQQVDAASPDGVLAELDWFAPGSFANLTDDQALTRRGFERLAGGLRFGSAGVATGPAVQRTLTILQIRLPAAAQSTLVPAAFPDWVVAAVFRAEGASPATAAARAVTVTEERWTVVDRTTGETVTGLPGAAAQQLAALSPTAAGRVAVPAGDHLPELVF